jgi:hypothetical protein
LPTVKPHRKHILVTGPHRSGTTWIGRTISQNSNVELVYEPFNLDFSRYNFEYKFDYWFEHVPSSKKIREIERAFDQYIPNRFWEYPLKICRESGYNIKTPLTFLKYLILSYTRPRYLLKDPIALLSAGWLYERYNLQVICITRKPLSFAGSLKVLNWDFDFSNFLGQEKLMETQLAHYKEEMTKVHREGDFTDRIALLWNVLNDVILQYRQSYPEWLFIKHEEVAIKPFEKFQEIFRYLNVPYDDEVRRYIRKYTSKDNPAEAGSNRYQPRDAKKTLNAWKERLTPEEAERISKATDDIHYRLYENK